MTLDAPLHLQRRIVKHQRHAIDRTVASVATNPFVDVNTVVEIDKIRQIVDPIPDQRLARAEAFANRLENRSRGPNLRMAIHARFGGRNPSKARVLDRGVTVTAINAERSHVMLMAKRRGLGPCHAGIGYIRRALKLNARPKGKGERKDAAVDRES